MPATRENGILESMAVLADPVRCRLLLLVEAEELTVSDLCAVMQLPQSTVSRHLKTLADNGWVDSRRDQTRRRYRGTIADLSETAQQLWDLTRAEISASSAGRNDRQRLRAVLARSRSRSQSFFDTSSEHWDALRDELFGDKFYLFALMGLVPGDAVVADLGCGTGTVAAALAPFVDRVIGIDASSAMLAVADARLAPFRNTELREGELESLPIEDGTVDVAILMLVLHHLENPANAVREAARILRPGGRLLIVDMLPHDRAAYQAEMGHLWLGFSEDDINGFLARAGLEGARYRALPPATDARGPNLFAVSAGKGVSRK